MAMYEIDVVLFTSAYHIPRHTLFHFHGTGNEHPSNGLHRRTLVVLLTQLQNFVLFAASDASPRVHSEVLQRAHHLRKTRQLQHADLL